MAHQSTPEAVDTAREAPSPRVAVETNGINVITEAERISTVLPAPDAGVPVRVVGDACAGSGDGDHERALRVMSLYAPLVHGVTTAEVLAGR